jgi:hypothetical protein
VTVRHVNRMNGLMMGDPISEPIQAIDNLVDRLTVLGVQMRKSVPESRRPKSRLVSSGEEIAPESKCQFRDHLAVNLRNSSAMRCVLAGLVQLLSDSGRTPGHTRVGTPLAITCQNEAVVGA